MDKTNLVCMFNRFNRLVSHRLILKVAPDTSAVGLVTLPQTVLMILYAMLSLMIIAEPMTMS